MPLFGKIVVIKRNGTDGISFPLTASSCLFGRRTECDIRIQLPQVSKEHCKIEVNENKEAILTNLSTVNPTQLNGGCFQQPVPLKHGDVLTIIDRSFRFEYPLQSTPRKKLSRTPKDETLQVLHVQQVAEVELLRKQTPGSKSLHASDNAECEEKNANENKESTEENISKAVPIKLQTPKSSHRIHQSSKKQYEMSPFSKLYEKMQEEIKVKNPLHEGNGSQQAVKEAGKSVVLEPSAQISSSSCVSELGSLTKEKEIGRSEHIEECKIIQQDVICSQFNQISAAGSATKKSFTRSPRTSVSKEMSSDIGKRSHLQDHKELSAAGKSEGTEVTTRPRKESDGNAEFSLKQCTIECLGYADEIKTHSSASALDKLPQTTNTTNVSEADKYVLSTPTSRRKGLWSCFISPTKEPGGMSPVNTDTPTPRRRVSLKRKCFSEIPPEAPREDVLCSNESLKQLPLAENKCLKQRRNSKQHTPGKPGPEEVPKEVCDQANFVNSEEGHSETPASLSKSKSPRRNNRQSKESSNRSVHLESPASEEFTSEQASPAGQKSGSGRKKGKPRSSGLHTEKALEANPIGEHRDQTTDREGSGTKEELATKGYHQKQGLEDAGVTRPRRLSSMRRSSGSAAVLQDNEAVSKMNTSGLLAGEESGKRKRMSEKRKSGDLLLQPLGKRKRVSFGGHLSPELFDKSLPPNSPLKKGAMPARLSLPFGNSPRAVLRKAQGLKHLAIQKEKKSPKNVPVQKSPAASSPASGKATPTFPLGSPAPYSKGRFSVSHVTTPSPIAEEKDAVAEDTNPKEKNDAQVKTPQSSHVNQDDKTSMATSDKPTRSAQLASKVTPMKRRSEAVAVINAKRRSGASGANLLVAKSWAEVVKLGVARPQSRSVKKSVRKGRSQKKITRLPKTPESKIKGHFSTGHAESPATIVVGRAYSTTVRTAGQVPKVVKNPLLKLNMNMDESFTGMTEMFQTPENKSEKTLPLDTVEKTDFTPTCMAVDISELHTPEECGEMLVSPLNSSDASDQKQDSPGICHFLREKEYLKSMFEATSTPSPEKRKAILEENISVGNLSIIPEKQTSRVKSRSKRRTPKQKLEPVEVTSGFKQLLKTPEQRSEPVEDLSGIKQLMKTPKQKPEPVEALSGIKQLMKTPKQKPEPVEALSGIKQLMKTPKQKPEPVEALSGIKRLMKTPKQKPEPVEALSGIKRLMKTPKQKPEPVEALSGIKRLLRAPKQKSEPVEALSGIKSLMKTPKQKPEPVEALSGSKSLMKTPKQKPEPVEALSGIKRLLRTPKQKLEPAEVLSGIRQLMRTPQQKPEPVEVLSGIKELMRAPQQELEPVTDEIALKRLLKTPVQKGEAGKDVAGVTFIKKTPKQKYQPVEDMIGVGRLFKTPKEKIEPIEDVFGISRLMKTPREKHQPVDDFVGLHRLMAEPRQKRSDFEVDCDGIAEMFAIPEESKVGSANVMESKQEDIAPPCTNSSHKNEDKGNISQGEESQQKDSTNEDKPTLRRTRVRPRNTVRPASTKQCEKDLNLNELQGLEKKSTQEEIGEISTSPSVGRGRRANPCIQEQLVSKQPEQEKVETVSLVEPHGATRRRGRGKRKEPTELKQPSENLESCGKDSSALQKEPANMEQTLQEYGGSDIVESEGDPTMKTVSVSSSIQNESSQLQTSLKNPENKSNEGGVEDSEEMLLSPGKRAKGAKNVNNTEPPIPPKRGRKARQDQVQQAASKDLRGTMRKLRKDTSATVTEREEQTFNKDTETATAEESENRAKLEVKITEKRVKSLRSARKLSTEVKADVCGMALENIQNIQKTKETSAEIDPETQAHIKNGIEVSQGDETENAQENATEASQRLKAESPFGETNKMPVTALSLEANRSAVQETNRTRRRRGKNDSLEKKPDEFTKDVNNLERITPQIKSETEKDDQSNPASTAIPVANSDSLAPSRPKRARTEQGMLKLKQTEILQENQAENSGTACRRGRSRKVNLELEEANSKAVAEKGSLPGHAKGMTYEDGQDEASENPSSQVRRSRRKQADSMPQTACSTFMDKQTLIADHSKDEAVVKEQDSPLEATPSSTEDIPLRRRRRREVAAASQTSRAPSVRKRRGLLEGDDKETTVREDQNPALGNKTLQAKATASARDKRKKIDVAAEAKSSSSLQGKCGVSETDDKEESTNGEQNMPLETVSCAKEKPLRRGRRKETAPASRTTNYIARRGKRGLSSDKGRDEAPQEDQNVQFLTSDSSVKENQVRKGRRKEIAFLLEASSSTSIQGTQGKDETPEEQQSVAAPSAKANPSRGVRRKTIASKSEETSAAFLREKPLLPKDRAQKRILKEGEDTPLENNSSQEKPWQLRNKRKKEESTTETATSVCKNSDLPGNGNASETGSVCSTSSGATKNNQSAKEEEVKPIPQATATSHKRKCQLRADDLATKKLKSENDDNRWLRKGKRNKSKEELGEEDARTTWTAGGTDRKTRSSTRTRK
ncbi:proliferation marker protein Ki-67 [Podargus strigoides]